MTGADRGTSSGGAAWPALPLEAWADTYATLHRWVQIAGKVRLRQTPWVNHSWHATLYVTPIGLTTSPIPYGGRAFEIVFDFLHHELSVACNDGGRSAFALEPQTVAAFYRRLMEAMAALGLHVDIDKRPNEMADAIPFDQDHVHTSYDREYATRFWQVLVQVDRVLKAFRAEFVGKCSPVHLFWGGLDLAVTRFSGRPAPAHPGGIPNLPDWVTREAYSHEVSSCGFWPGGGPISYPAFYAYGYPEPPGLAEARVVPTGAFYSADLREFILPYHIVREADAPDAALGTFLRSTYEAVADLGKWDRAALERSRDPRPR
jgi:hypothetical protein